MRLKCAGKVCLTMVCSLIIIRPAVADIEIKVLDANNNPATSVGITKWEGAFDASRQPKSDFYKSASERFYIQVKDPSNNVNPGVADSLSATLRKIDVDRAIADQIVNFPLLETGRDTGVFQSEPFVLVSNAVDDEFTANSVVDGQSTDPTLNIMTPGKLTASPLSVGLGGSVRVDYRSSTGNGPAGTERGEYSKQVPICGTVKHIVLRPMLLRRTPGGATVAPITEVQEGFALMNVAWAQCCIQVEGGADIQVIDPPQAEPFSNTGFDDDADPTTANINPTAGFDFIDVDGDNLHDAGEPSESFTDTNGNGGYDFGLNLADGSMDEFDKFPTREERSLIDSFADGDARTVEFFVVNRLSPDGSRGEAFIPASPKLVDNLTTPNVIIVRARSLGINGATARDFVTASHEVGHVLLNSFHRPRGTIAGRINLMVGGGTDSIDAVNASKRLSTGQCNTARGF